MESYYTMTHHQERFPRQIFQIANNAYSNIYQNSNKYIFQNLSRTIETSSTFSWLLQKVIPVYSLFYIALFPY